MARPTAQSTVTAFKGSLIFLLSGAFWAIPPGLVQAQEVAGENAQENAGALEEIIVTATRRAENLQSIAIAVNVMDADYLESQHIDQIKDVIDKSPGTSFTLLNKMQNAYSMRGLSSQTEGAAGDPSILTVSDDVVVVKDYLKSAEFFDLERVEVLRGPQGTSFGRNATAGLIHLISKRPTRETESFISAGFGNYGHAEADGYLNSAFGANGAARLAVHYTSHDGYTRDVVRNVDLGSEENLSLRGSLLFNPSDDLEVYFKAEYSKDDDGAPVRQPRLCTSPQENFTDFIDPCSPWATAGSEFAGSDDTSGLVYNPGERFYLEREVFNLTGQVFWNINDTLTLTSISGYIDGKGGYNMDATGTPRDLQFSIARNDSWQFTQELRLDNLAAGEPLGWLFGLYYLTDDHDQTSGRRWFQEDLSVYGPGPLFTPTTVQAVSNNQTESLGVFGELNFDFTEKLSGTVGLRYTSDKKDFIISHNGTGRNGPVTTFLLDVPSN
ncbi:MAG TPA: TonB-dependent receptor, partial [Xanthomonadales bacterium]|nr:TonB-dependent receptor [Xanthomonadales bacterium]